MKGRKKNVKKPAKRPHKLSSHSLISERDEKVLRKGVNFRYFHSFISEDFFYKADIRCPVHGIN